MKYSNFFKIDLLLIFKILLCLYILLSPYIQHNLILTLVDDNGIKILILLLILYFIEIDYIISVLLSICLIIMIVLYNRKNIEVIKSNYVLKNDNIKEKEEDIEDINEILKNEEKIAEADEINNAMIIENYENTTEDNLEKIQSNIFNKKNNLIYFSGNYDNSVVTAQGELELV